MKNRGAKKVRVYALMDARRKNDVEIDGACFKGDFYKAYFGVGMDVLGVGGIEDGKHKLDIRCAGKRKPKRAHDKRILKPSKRDDGEQR